MELHSTPREARPEPAQAVEKPTSTYVETVRDGAVGAGIFRGQNKHYFVLSRAWKSAATGNSGHSSSFYPGNAKTLAKVVTEAAERCQELDKASAPNQ
jgi:hypothetical protein